MRWTWLGLMVLLLWMGLVSHWIGQLRERKLLRVRASGGYADLTVTELRVLLNERGLSLSGKKADMIERLENDDASDESNGEDEEVTEEEGDEVAEDGSETGSE